MSHPYQSLPETAFWRSAVAEKNPLQVSGLWTPKFPIALDEKIVTAGSCFAQHIGRAMSKRGYSWFDAETRPPFLKEADLAAFNYGIFSFRTGNIYTARTLLQWVELAFGVREEIDEWWDADGRFFDPLRPAIEPGGFADIDEARASRLSTLAAIRKAVTEARVFVFTLGLTESWFNRETEVEYALCPGTLAGTFDDARHVFRNHRHAQIHQDMTKAIDLMRSKNPDLRFLLTVSPVPLTATASGQHVLTATSYSKSVLRAVAGDLAADLDFVDYFPSYEIITHPIFRGMFYAPNQRQVVPEGVEIVMRTFFAEQTATFGAPTPMPSSDLKTERRAARRQRRDQDIKCEEEMLDAFGR